jgi:hypothetical protein
MASDGEYRHRTVIPAILITSRHGALVAAKAIAIAIAGVVLSVLTLGLGLATIVAEVHAHGISHPPCLATVSAGLAFLGHAGCVKRASPRYPVLSRATTAPSPSSRGRGHQLPRQRTQARPQPSRASVPCPPLRPLAHPSSLVVIASASQSAPVSSSAHIAFPAAVSRSPHLRARASIRTKPKPDSSSLAGRRGCGKRGSASSTSIRRTVCAASSRSTMVRLSVRVCSTALVTSSDTSRTAVSWRCAMPHESSASQVARRASLAARPPLGSDNCREHVTSVPAVRGGGLWLAPFPPLSELGPSQVSLLERLNLGKRAEDPGALTMDTSSAGRWFEAARVRWQFLSPRRRSGCAG